MQQSDKDEILEAVTHGFACTQRELGKINQWVETIEQRLDKMEERQLFLEMKIDNRFNLLEGMMRNDRQQDRDEVKELAVRVSRLEAATATA